MNGTNNSMNVSRSSISISSSRSSTRSVAMNLWSGSVMKLDRGRAIAKLLEAIGISATMIALVQGIFGDMWGELYLFIGGIVAFVAGRQIEKRLDKAQKDGGQNPPSGDGQDAANLPV